jgi:hypothetical protein
MKHLAALLHVPSDILGYVSSLVVASGAMVATTIQGIFPTPDAAAEWPFYGVLISSNVVLFLSVAGILRWVGTKWLAQQAVTTAAIVENSEALKKVSETLEKQNTWFTDFGKNALQFQFEHARMSVHAQHQQEGGGHEHR